MRAAHAGHLTAVKCLIEGGAHLNTRNHFEQNAMALAKQQRHTEVVDYLKSIALAQKEARALTRSTKATATPSTIKRSNKL